MEITHNPFPMDYGDVQMQIDYRHALHTQKTDRRLYLAIPSQIYDRFFRLKLVEKIVQEQQILIVVYNIKTGDIRWIN